MEVDMSKYVAVLYQPAPEVTILPFLDNCHDSPILQLHSPSSST